MRSRRAAPPPLLRWARPNAAAVAATVPAWALLLVLLDLQKHVVLGLALAVVDAQRAARGLQCACGGMPGPVSCISVCLIVL